MTRFVQNRQKVVLVFGRFSAIRCSSNTGIVHGMSCGSVVVITKVVLMYNKKIKSTRYLTSPLTAA